MSIEKYLLVEKYCSENEFGLAFSLCKELVSDDDTESFIKVYCFNWMGVIIGNFDPALDEQSDFGIEYLNSAVLIDPNCVECLHNIVVTYGERAHGHSDKKSFESAYRNLRVNLYNQLNDSQKKSLNRVRDYYKLDF
jgi:hypothetical protein